MSVEDWSVDWQEKTATHTNGLKLKFMPRDEFNRKYDISPREGRIALRQPEGWMRLVIGGLAGDRMQSVNDLLPLLQEGQEAFQMEVARQARGG